MCQQLGINTSVVFDISMSFQKWLSHQVLHGTGSVSEHTFPRQPEAPVLTCMLCCLKRELSQRHASPRCSSPSSISQDWTAQQNRALRHKSTHHYPIGSSVCMRVWVCMWMYVSGWVNTFHSMCGGVCVCECMCACEGECIPYVCVCVCVHVGEYTPYECVWGVSTFHVWRRVCACVCAHVSVWVSTRHSMCEDVRSWFSLSPMCTLEKEFRLSVSMVSAFICPSTLLA